MYVQHLKSVAETLVDAAQKLSELLLRASVCAIADVVICYIEMFIHVPYKRRE